MGQSADMASMASAGPASAGPASPAVLEIRDPSDLRSVVAEVPAMSAAEVAAVYQRARAGFVIWRRAGPLERAAVLAAGADLIRSRAEQGAVTLVRENGKTLAEARVEVTKAADFLDYYASFTRQPWGEILADPRGRTQTSVRTEPVGVVLAITPRNDPLLTPARKLGPALIAGNAVVLKPSRQTPMIAAWLADLLAEADLPDGVIGVVTGRGQDISQALLGHPDLDALTFTGSTATGNFLRQAFSACNVRLQTVTGGKNASVVLADADLELAALCPAEGFDEAVGLANDSRYGLSAAVFTNSLRLAYEFLDRAEAGQVSVNLPTSGWDVRHPFGSFRDSGSPFKEQGAPGLRFYTLLKTAAVRFAW